MNNIAPTQTHINEKLNYLKMKKLIIHYLTMVNSISNILMKRGIRLTFICI